MIIEPDSPLAEKIGFTSNLFEGYLWIINNDLYISFIVSKNPKKGNFSRLLETIEKQGYTIKVPIPLGKMKSILEKKRFNPTYEKHDHTNEYVLVMKK